MGEIHRFVSLRILLLIFTGVCLPDSVDAQDFMLEGKILDTIGASLPNANILAFPESEGEQTRFAISNSNGDYQLKLAKEVSYRIEVSYLGYEKQSLQLKIGKDSTKNFVLLPAVDRLDEVVLNYKIPIIVKKDTIIYDTDAFVDGEERKLREVLKKLPGVEVDRDGNVRVKGKKVTKVMVEDKVFFTGNSGLAVNNIPADAVDQIEILDNYSEVGFLKGLEDSDQMAMNIRLKKDKQKFAFGDIEAGAGIQDRYLLHPTLFYYSPKTNINFIGDLNNTGQKSFTIKDYIDFEGGFGRLMGDIKGFSNLYTDDFSKYLANQDFKENTNQFGAFNLRQTVSNKTDINTYVIANGSSTDTETRTLNLFSNNNEPFTENRNTNETFDNFFVIGKLTLDHTPSSTADVAANTFVKLSNNEADGNIITTNPFQDNTFRTLATLDAISLKQNIAYSKKFSKVQTLSLETTLDYKKNRPNTNWISNAPFLDELVPLENDTNYNIFQQIENESTNFDFILKDYWVLNNFNHVYTSLGTHIARERYTTADLQGLSTGGINDFSANGFGNDISYRFNDIFIGMEYKFLIGILTGKAGLFYHNYSWENEQFDNKVSKSTDLLLPQFTIDAEFNSSEKLKFRYRAKANFPNSPNLTNNFLLTNFNQVFRGNSELANEKFHSLSLNYYKFSLFRGLNLNANLAYNKKTQSIKNTTQLQGIEQFRTLTMFNLPENSVTGMFNFSRKIKDIKYSVQASGSYNEFFQIVNGNTSMNISKTLNATGKIETFFEKAPNLEAGYTYSPSTFVTSFSTANFTNNEIFVNLQYDFLEDFQFKTNYSRFDCKNKDANISDVFDIANTSLFYQKEDSPWGFEVQVTNMFNTTFKRSNSFSDFLISDQTTFILPRIILFKLSYKL